MESASKGALKKVGGAVTNPVRGLSCHSDLELLSPTKNKNWTPGFLSVSHLPCSGDLKTQKTESRDGEARRRGRMGASEEVIQQSLFPQNPHKCRVGVAASL